MSITLGYSCSRCKFQTQLLDYAQEHSNKTGHTVDVSGTLTPEQKVGVLRELEKNAEVKARSYEILRQARAKGLV